MTNLFSGLVLGSGALLASPALWAAFVDGTMSVGTAVVRLGVAVLVSWVGWSLLGSLMAGTTGRLTDPVEVPLPRVDDLDPGSGT